MPVVVITARGAETKEKPKGMVATPLGTPMHIFILSPRQ